MTRKVKIDTELAIALRDVDVQQSGRPAASDDVYAEMARASRRTMGAVVRSYAEALASACVQTGHAGAIRRGSGAGIPCAACRTKIRHVSKAADLIEPDRA